VVVAGEHAHHGADGHVGLRWVVKENSVKNRVLTVVGSPDN
jgi:hypothetical protein